LAGASPSRSDGPYAAALRITAEGISLNKMFELGSLFEGHVGLTNVWELSFDGKLEKKPWLEK